MDPITCRPFRLDDAPGWTALHRSHFPPLSDEAGLRWARRPDVTAAIAISGSQVVGAIPFHIRDFQINPRVTIRGAFEHAVIVAESMRDRGIGSQMMDAARQFLAPQCDALMVYRGGERSIGYRFYTKAGHHDLSYLRPYVLESPAPQPPQKVSRSQHDLLLEREAEYDAVFRSAFGSFGGFRQRGPGYWADAFSSAYFDMIPQELVLLTLEEAGAIQGYALLSREPEKRVHNSAHLLELATRGGSAGLARPLLREAMTVCAEWDTDLRAYSADHSPYAALLVELGLRAVPRAESSMMTMAYVIDPAALGPRVWQENDEAAPLEVSVWTPQREALIHPATCTTSKTVMLEMKEDTLTRLLFSRLDLRAAVRQELVTVVGGSEPDVDAIARALPFAPWAYHHLDYI